MQTINGQIARELGVREQQIDSTVALLDEGATVPFIARYRKEVTGGLDDGQLRTLAERLVYLRDLDDRRQAILRSIDEQGKLTPELKKAVLGAETKSSLEDLYLPYKKKRRTRAQIAREAGLEPLARALFDDPTQEPMARAAAFVDEEKGIADAAAALDGARQILMEEFSEDATLSGQLRDYLAKKGYLVSLVIPGKEQEGAKFRDYFDYREPLAKIPSHRALALFRGRNEGILNLQLLVEGEEEADVHPCAALTARHFGLEDRGRPADAWLLETARWAWKIKLFGRLELDLKGELKEQASDQAIDVFAENLRDLLLAAPAGARVTMGLDPGLRTGVKVAVVDATGKVLDTATIYPHAPKKQWDASLAVLAELCRRHGVNLVSIGNGTASRETDRLAAQLCSRHPELKLSKLVVSEAGASVYSASELAADELPDLDVSLRGAVSIARRLQDPLAELVKIDPKSIGVGQYQHDVSQVKLARKLDTIVEDCVNSVGVDVNIASAPLLARVAGLSTSLARNIVDYRNSHGAFRERGDILSVPRMGEKAFEQAGGFLRIVGGSNPLDNSAVHPEAYPLVHRILERSGRDIRALIGDGRFLRGLRPDDFTDEHFGVPTVSDILRELEKPGRDPRPEFTTAAFREGVESIGDLETGMILEGVVSNVTHFGAFVDIGVHQDGLVHISMLADKFVKDPRDVVKAGDVVKVKVLEVDVARKRIALTMRMQETPEKGAKAKAAPAAGERPRGRKQPAKDVASGNSAMADALRKGLNL